VNNYKKYFTFSIITFFSISLLASSSSGENSLIHQMTTLVFQLSIVIFTARIGGIIFKRLKLPEVLGELSGGIVIGPYMFGSISIPGFPHGIFPMSSGSGPISPELYGFAVIASIILLFLAGLETDIKLLKKYALTGSIVGIGGLIASFFLGNITGMLILDIGFMDPKALFLGVMSTATSVGITARTLSERRAIDSPEGVTILAGAVIDDVLGIILLAIVLGISTIVSSGGGEEISWGSIGFIAFKAIGVWLFFTVAGLILAQKISQFLKLFKDKYVFTILSLGMALFLAGIFEQAGLAMIIGAYVMGIALSNTDLNFVIQETLHPLKVFFIPLFFTIMGMFVDMHAFLSKETLILGIIFSLGAIIAKVAGCGIPAFFLNFNKIGALRIGFGMAPRGEVVLIIAGIGLSTGFLDQSIFGVSIMLILFTTLISPPILDRLLRIRKSGVKIEPEEDELITTPYSMPSEEHSSIILTYIIQYFRKVGFFVNKMELDTTIYQIRKEDTFISLFCSPSEFIFKTTKNDTTMVKEIFDESIYKLFDTIEKLNSSKSSELINGNGNNYKRATDIIKFLSKECIIFDMKSETKKEIIEELIDALFIANKIEKREKVVLEVLEREKVMSTGMQNGIALPHARSKEVDTSVIAVGIKRTGIDFQSFDDKPAKVFVLLLSPEENNELHLQIFSEISRFLHKSDSVETLLKCKSEDDIWKYFKPER